MGRATHLTPLVQEKITTAVAAGVPVKFAAMLAGIPEPTVRTWMYLGRQVATGQNTSSTQDMSDDQALRYAAFYEAVEEARAKAVARNVANIQAAAEDSWQAAAWWLERTHPEHFARHTNVSVTTTDRLEEELRALLGDAEAERMIAAARAEAGAVGGRSLMPRALPRHEGEDVVDAEVVE